MPDKVRNKKVFYRLVLSALSQSLSLKMMPSISLCRELPIPSPSANMAFISYCDLFLRFLNRLEADEIRLHDDKPSRGQIRGSVAQIIFHSTHPSVSMAATTMGSEVHQCSFQTLDPHTAHPQSSRSSCRSRRRHLTTSRLIQSCPLISLP